MDTITSDMLYELKYFLGKVCSVHVLKTNWDLSPANLLDYYVGRVETISPLGISLGNVVNQKKTFIMLSAIVTIAEETVLEGGKAEHEKSVQEYEEKKQEVFKHNEDVMLKKEPRIADDTFGSRKPKPVTKVNDSPFVDIASMTAHVKAAKDKFKK